MVLKAVWPENQLESRAEITRRPRFYGGKFLMASKPITRPDILRMFGPIDDHRALEILGLNPSWEEMEVTMAYLADMSDIMGEERQPLSGCAAEIYDIVTRDESFEEEEAGFIPPR
jgi:hypothetical protein